MKLLAFIVVFIILSTTLAAACDVAYVLKKESQANQEIMGIFNDHNFNVDFIEDRELPFTNLSSYGLIFIDDTCLINNDIPIYRYPTVVMNSFYGTKFGLTGVSGIQTRLSDSNYAQLWNNNIISTYVDEKNHYLYYLPDADKVSTEAYARLANTTVSGDLVSLIRKGTLLRDGHTSQHNICFFGIPDTESWTEDSKDLFVSCMEDVVWTNEFSCSSDADCDDSDSSTQDVCMNPGTADSYCSHLPVICGKDSDCGTNSFVGDAYCVAGLLWRNFQTFSCENPGVGSAQCVVRISPQLIGDCTTPQLKHDIALIDFNDAISKILVQRSDGTAVTDNQLQCGQLYTMTVTAKNLGDFNEDVSLFGNIENQYFTLADINSLAPGISAQSSTVINLSVGSGNFDMSIFASIPGDIDEDNNYAIRSLQVSCGEQTCQDGDTRACGSSIGACIPGTQVCTNNDWGQCIGQIGPFDEVCGDNIDNDCDGSIDENCAPVICQDGDTRACGSSVGACIPGTQTCANNDWGECVGAIGPFDEVCDGIDNNCDGTIDEGCGCTTGDIRQCGTSDVGACSFGTQECILGIWTTCLSARNPVSEICDALDNDCDGSVDESACQCNDGIDNDLDNLIDYPLDPGCDNSTDPAEIDQGLC